MKAPLRAARLTRIWRCGYDEAENAVSYPLFPLPGPDLLPGLCRVLVLPRGQTREAVYGSLDESRQALDEFLASGDPAQLERSRQSIGDLLERVEQCGEYTGFLKREDNVGALVLGACTDFLDSAGRYMDRLDPAQLTQAQRQTLQDILGTLTDEDGGPTQFGTIYFQLLPAFPNGVVS